MKKMNQTVIIYLVTLMFPGLLQANETLNFQNKLKQCADIYNTEKRLACYDSLTQSLQSKKSPVPNILTNNEKYISPVPKTEELPVKVRSKQSDIEEEFAKPQIKTPGYDVKNISLTISALKKNRSDEWIITFTNGQVWQQKDGLRLSLKVGLNIKISKGALGAYYLKKKESNKIIKVKRLK
jgi:hypothetical protein